MQQNRVDARTLCEVHKISLVRTGQEFETLKARQTGQSVDEIAKHMAVGQTHTFLPPMRTMDAVWDTLTS